MGHIPKLVFAYPLPLSPYLTVSRKMQNNKFPTPTKTDMLKNQYIFQKHSMRMAVKVWLFVAHAITLAGQCT